MTRLKINFVVPGRGLSGGLRCLAMHAKHLQAMGHHVRVIAPTPRKKTIKEHLRRLVRGKKTWAPPQDCHFDALGVPVTHIGHQGLFDPDDLPNADITMGTWWETMEWVQGASPSKGTQVHFVQGHETFEHQPIERVKNIYRSHSPKIVVSRWLWSMMEKEYQRTPIGLVHNGVNTRDFFPESNTMTRDGIGVILSPLACKGARLAFEAMEDIKRFAPEATFISAGLHHPESFGLSLPKEVEFHASPSRDQLRQLYSRAKVWLFPSLEEGFGLPILEAMACGTPVASLPTAAAPDIIHHDKNGTLSPHCTAEGLAQATNMIWKKNDDEWQKNSASALDTAHQWSWESAAIQMVEQLKKIA